MFLGLMSILLVPLKIVLAIWICYHIYGFVFGL